MTSGIKTTTCKRVAYAVMYEELFGTPIDQIVILMASEDGAGRVFIKDKAEYLPELEKAIQHFYKYYQEKTKGTKS